MPIHHHLIVATIALSTAACTGDVREVVLSSTPSPCLGVGPTLCRTATEQGQTTLWYDAIEGYTPRWGTEATLRVRVEDVDDPPADGSSQRYLLDEVVATRDELPGTTFTTPFPAHLSQSTWFEPDVAGVVDYRGTLVACDPALCDQLVAPQPAGSAREVTFEHTGLGVPFRATAIAPLP